ncbi:MAG: alpha/beta hydrolase [Deltaproteobacteria bacterium]|jgi:fermentation-respiration switch protein FrsA (DUF1100 family)|nr:alpha/beta hydrolase [Deltaproteobacteria bacterium]
MSWLTKGYYIGGKGVKVRKLTPAKIAVRTLVTVMFITVLVVSGLFIFKDKMIYFPTKGLELSLAEIGWEFEEVWLKGTNDHKVNGWYLPAGPKAVLLLNGNAGNLEKMIGRIMMYHKLGYSVMACDYEGYGLSEGTPGEETLAFDAKAARDFLIAREFKPEDILIHGFSLGGAVAVRLARDTDHRGPLILDSTFTSLQDMGEVVFPLVKPISSKLLGGQYLSLELIGSLRPSFLLVFHSFNDELIPYQQGQKLFEAYQGGPKAFVQIQGRHLDFPLNVETYYKVIEENLGSGLPSKEELPPLENESITSEDGQSI